MNARLKSVPQFDELPDDDFGALVMSDSDRRTLIWLVNEVGESKIRRASVDLANKYDGAKPYVSTLLKRFGRKVPTHVWAPVKVLIYRVYCVVTADKTAFKVGFSGDWIVRACNLPNERKNPLDFIDLDKSFSVLVPGASIAARALEKSVLVNLKKNGFHIPPPAEFERYRASKKEWFHIDGYVIAQQLLRADEFGGVRSNMTLRRALEVDLYSADIEPILH